MATDQDSTTIPSEGKFVGPRDPITHDYPLYFDGEVVAHARTRAEGVQTLDELAFEILRHRARWVTTSSDTPDAAVVHPADEDADELAEARVVAAALAPSGAPVAVGYLADGTPVTSGRTTHGHPRPLRVTTEQGYLFVSTRGLAGRWGDTDLRLDATQINTLPSIDDALDTAQRSALAGLLAAGTLNALLQLARAWEQAAWRWSRRAQLRVAA